MSGVPSFLVGPVVGLFSLYLLSGVPSFFNLVVLVVVVAAGVAGLVALVLVVLVCFTSVLVVSFFAAGFVFVVAVVVVFVVVTGLAWAKPAVPMHRMEIATISKRFII
jgi:hypothetical protein